MKHIKLFEDFIVEKKSYANSAFLFGGFFTGIQRKGIGKAVISDLFKSNPKIENLLLYTQDDAIGFWKKTGGNVVSQGNDKNGILRYFVQINRNDVDSSVGTKELGISYKNKSTKTSKLSKGEYDIKMGRQKIGFFFVKDTGTIEENPMDIIIESVTVNKVECDNCGWEWKLQEGGEDVFICHTCGHDNSPKIVKESEEDPRLARIRHFKGSVQDLKDFVQSKVEETNYKKPI